MKDPNALLDVLFPLWLAVMIGFGLVCAFMAGRDLMQSRRKRKERGL